MSDSDAIDELLRFITNKEHEFRVNTGHFSREFSEIRRIFGWRHVPLGDDCEYCKRCGKDVGTRPSWMSPDQYDPCPCLLPINHDGGHRCSHD